MCLETSSCAVIRNGIFCSSYFLDDAMTALLHISNNEGVETDRITWRAGAEVFSSGIVWKGFGNTDIILSFLKRSISPGKYR